MKVFAHRGLSGIYPENTMLAFQRAGDESFDGIELDVQLTRDGQVVIIHDETVDRTTDGSGLVVAHSLDEIRKLNAARIRPDSTQPLRIPTLDEYCEWASSASHIVTNIEIKSSVVFYPGLEEKTFNLVQKYGLEERVFFSSFNHLSMILMKKIAPEIPSGALVEEQGLMFAGFYCEQFGFDYFHPGLPSVTAESVIECHAHGIPMHVWTVDAQSDWERMESFGVDGIFTNYVPGTK